MTTDQRKQDTRQKIELGGLIVKAGLRDCNRAALYAGLVEVAERLEDPDEHQRLTTEGRKLFSRERDR